MLRVYNAFSQLDQWCQLHGAQGGTCLPQFYKCLGMGQHSEYRNSKHETDQTVVTITKELTKTTNCTLRANENIFRCPHFCTRPVPPLSNSFQHHWTWLQKFTYICKCLSFLGQLNIHPYRILAPYFCAEWSGGTNCGNTVLPLQLSHCVTATNQKPANPIHQHVLHNTVARSHVSPTYGLCVSASGYWHACTHASNRGFPSNANLTIKLLHLLVWLGDLSSADQWSTFYIHCVYTQLKGRTTNTHATQKKLQASLASINLPKPLPLSRSIACILLAHNTVFWR